MSSKSGVSTQALASARVMPQRAHNIRTLVDDHFAFIARSVRRLGVTDSEVDDAAQQVFLIAAQKIERIALGSEKPFLYGIAMRVASEVRRSARRRVARESTVALSHGVMTAETPEEIARSRQARAVLDEILDVIPEGLRSVFTLYELEEMTMAEISVLLEIPAGSVASRLRRAREIFQFEAAKRR
jgi:RNA polymerase sigma-70 factor (ECF subfamily)